MQVKKTQSGNEATLVVSVDPKYMADIKEHTLKKLAHKVKLDGFRGGKAPLNLVEKNLEPQLLQTEFLDDALNNLYPKAAQKEKLRPVDKPRITITKFVPFTELEFKAEVEVIGEVKLPNYKNFKITQQPVTVTSKDVDGVLQNLKTRMADKKDVTRAAKNGDEVVIDFKGVDDKGKQIPGAEGNDYSLLLGSNMFIPGFESNLVGMAENDKKAFTLKFPTDYSVSSLANKSAKFSVTLKKVQQVAEQKIDDNFAKKVGPFKNLDELKADIKKQLKLERTQEAQRAFENELITMLAQKTEVVPPKTLINEQVERDLQQVKQNLAYRGQTYDEFLKSQNKSDQDFRVELSKEATNKVKASLALSEIAEIEKIEVTPEELEIRLQALKGQYQDQAMQAELSKPEARQEIASRMITEKTIAKLVESIAK